MAQLKSIPTIPTIAKPKSQLGRVYKDKSKAVSFYALKETLYSQTKEQLIAHLNSVEEERNVLLFNTPLLHALGIEGADSINEYDDLTLEEWQTIILYIWNCWYPADPKSFKSNGAQWMDTVYSPRVHLTSYCNLKMDELDDKGSRPEYHHTLSLGFNTQESALSFMVWLYDHSEKYGIKLVGFRTNNFHTESPVELKVWLNSDCHQQQLGLIDSLSSK